MIENVENMFVSYYEINNQITLTNAQGVRENILQTLRRDRAYLDDSESVSYLDSVWGGGSWGKHY